MRYRAKNDFISTDQEGRKTLVAKGDKVYVQQLNGGWDVFSFYSRKSLGIFTKEDFHELFGPEKDFRKPPREPENDGIGDSGKFKGRTFKKFFIALLFSLPLGSMAQVSPVQWSFKAVRVDSNHFEFHVIADIYRGWFLYPPNNPKYEYSPKITFEKSSAMEPIEGIETLEYPAFAENEDKVYRNTVVFIQLFKMPINRSAAVKGSIVYQAVSPYYTEQPVTVKFKLTVGPDEDLIRSSCAPKVILTIPKGKWKRTLRQIQRDPRLKKEPVQ